MALLEGVGVKEVYNTSCKGWGNKIAVGETTKSYYLKPREWKWRWQCELYLGTAASGTPHLQLKADANYVSKATVHITDSQGRLVGEFLPNKTHGCTIDRELVIGPSRLRWRKTGSWWSKSLAFELIDLGTDQIVADMKVNYWTGKGTIRIHEGSGIPSLPSELVVATALAMEKLERRRINRSGQGMAGS